MKYFILLLSILFNSLFCFSQKNELNVIFKPNNYTKSLKDRFEIDSLEYNYPLWDQTETKHQNNYFLGINYSRISKNNISKEFLIGFIKTKNSFIYDGLTLNNIDTIHSRNTTNYLSYSLQIGLGIYKQFIFKKGRISIGLISPFSKQVYSKINYHYTEKTISTNALNPYNSNKTIDTYDAIYYSVGLFASTKVSLPIYKNIFLGFKFNIGYSYDIRKGKTYDKVYTRNMNNGVYSENIFTENINFVNEKKITNQIIPQFLLSYFF